MTVRHPIPWLALATFSACSFAKLPDEPPPLRDMEEPLQLLAEPEDEAARQALPAGSFSGLTVEDSRDTISSKLSDQGSLRVSNVVENSPAHAAGVQVDDLLVAVRVGDGQEQAVTRASQWRKLELETPPGTVLTLSVDRANQPAETKLTLVPRVGPAPRVAGERLREEQRVGVVFRTATEVEARNAGLGPGGGAVIVGLSRGSPWRAAGLRFGDLLVAIDGQPIAHPQDLLNRLRESPDDAATIRFFRAGQTTDASARFTSREQQTHEINVPLLFSYERNRGRKEWSVLFGFLGYRSTSAAWRMKVLWFISFGGGDADRLIEVDQ